MTSDVSYFGEGRFLEALLKRFPNPRHFVDIGAGDIGSVSNVRGLALSGFSGLLVDSSAHAYEQNLLFSDRYNPSIVPVKQTLKPCDASKLLHAYRVPKLFSLLSLDIDSFEPYFLEDILTHYSPLCICVEINERIPPGIEYRLLYDEGLIGIDLTLISSGSISTMCKLLHAFGYNPIRLIRNNLIATHHSLAFLVRTDFELWYEGFYFTNWRNDMPWNLQFLEIIEGNKPDAIRLLEAKFKSTNIRSHISLC